MDQRLIMVFGKDMEVVCCLSAHRLPKPRTNGQVLHLPIETGTTAPGKDLRYLQFTWRRLITPAEVALEYWWYLETTEGREVCNLVEAVLLPGAYTDFLRKGTPPRPKPHPGPSPPKQPATGKHERRLICQANFLAP